MNIGFTELILILIIGVCVLGPQKAEKFAASLGRGVRSFKSALSEAKDITEPVTTEIKEIKESIDSIGKEE